MSTSGPLAANKALFRDLGYDPQKDFAPICLFATLPNIVVINAKLPPKTLAELIDYAKATPEAAQLRLGRHRLLATSGRRLFRTTHGNAARPHPLQEYRQLCARLHLRPGAGRISTAAERSRPDQERRCACACGGQQQTHDGVARCADGGRGRPARLRERCVACVAGARQHRQGYRRSDCTPRHRRPRKIRRCVRCSPSKAPNRADLGPEDLKKFIASEISKWSEVIGKLGIAPM